MGGVKHKVSRLKTKLINYQNYIAKIYGNYDKEVKGHRGEDTEVKNLSEKNIRKGEITQKKKIFFNFPKWKQVGELFERALDAKLLRDRKSRLHTEK